MKRSVLILSLLVFGAMSAVTTGCAGGSEDPDSPSNNDKSDNKVGNERTAKADDSKDEPKVVDLPGLEGEVTVRYDKWGVLHIECQAMIDCFVAEGYYHANDRFFEMDMIRRQVRGELAALVGAPGLTEDKSWRHRMTTKEGKPLEDVFYEAIDPQYKKFFKAYAKGVNAWLGDLKNGENGAKLTSEYDYPLIDKEARDKWEPQDSVALYLNLAQSLANTSKRDLFRGRAFSKLDSKVAKDIFTPRTITDSYTLQSAQASEPKSLMRRDDRESSLGLDRVEQIHERLREARPAIEGAMQDFSLHESILSRNTDPGVKGSNSWVVGGSRTATNAPMLANDPHLTLMNPSIFYMVELHSTGEKGEPLHVAGASIPAVPGIIAGQNENLAWGVTVARLDVSDVYIETLNDEGTAVIHNGKEVPIKTREFSFEVNGGSTVTETFEWVPHHGPLISKDLESKKGVSMSWVAQEGGKDIEFIFELMQAETVEEGIDAVSTIRNINANWSFVDTSGSIGWSAPSLVPKRPWASPETPNWLPLPGDGSADWQGFMEKESLPSMVDPVGDMIVTANNDIDGSYADGKPSNEQHPVWQSPPVPGYRHQRIVEMIRDRDDIDVDGMFEMQGDVLSSHGRRLTPHILDALEQSDVELTDGARKVQKALKSWEYGCPTGLKGKDPTAAEKATDDVAAKESVGCAAFHVLLRRLTNKVFGDELSPLREIDPSVQWPNNRWPALQVALVDLFEQPESLANGTDYFDDKGTDGVEETKGQVLANTLDKTAEVLKKQFKSGNPDDWRWGRIHTVELPSLLAQAGLDQFNHGPFASDGATYTVDLAPPVSKSGDYHHKVGPATRLVFKSTEDGMTGWFQLPGGQSNHRDSKHYMDLLDDWMKESPHKLKFEQSAVEAAAVETIEIKPSE